MPRPKRLDSASPERNVVGSLSPWCRWDARRSITDGHDGVAYEYGGVYLLAHLGAAPAGVPADPCDDRIVYIGEGSHLGRRWYQFERSAKRGLPGHSGGHSYRVWAKRNKVPWDTLYVAAYPIWFASEGDTNDPTSLAKRFRLFLEQKLLLDLVAHRRDRSELHLLNAK